MRHQNLKGKLGLNDSHREAMLRNLLLSLLKHERICTTLARAKQLKRYADQIIEWGKTSEWTAKRHVRMKVHDKEAFRKLFTVYGPRFKERNGGYTRIFQLGSRHGDGAKMSLIEILPDISKENEPRIIKEKRKEGEAAVSASEGAEKKKLKDKEPERIKKEILRGRAEAKKARQAEDILHSHKSQGRKTDKGTGRSKASKKGLS